MAETTKEFVNHPLHYNQGGIECIDALQAIGIAEDFALGNAIKYLWRCKEKRNRVQDVAKAIWYLEWLKREWENQEKGENNHVTD